MPPEDTRTDSDGTPRLSRVNRRRFLATSAVSVAGLAGCLGGTQESADTDTPDSRDDEDDGSSDSTTGTASDEQPYAGDTLTAAVWSGSDNWMNAWRNEIVPRFEEKTGATVELTTVWAEILSKIKAAPENDPPFDVTVTDGYDHLYGTQSDLWQPIRYENIPNYDDVYPYLKEFRPDDVGVPVSGMPMAILYRSDQSFKPETWSDFGSDAGIQAKIGMEGSWYGYPASIVAITMDEEPKADELYDEQYHEAIFDELNRWDINSWYSGGAEFWEQLRNGVIVASQYYMNTHRDAKDDPDIGFQYPTEGSVWYWDHYHVVRGTDHRRLAEEWINHLLDPEIQSISAELQYNAAANKKADLRLDILKENYPTKNSQWEEKAVFFDVPYLNNHYSTFNDYFKQVKTGSWDG